MFDKLDDLLIRYEELMSELTWDEPEEESDVSYTDSVPFDDVTKDSPILYVDNAHRSYVMPKTKCPECGETIIFEGGCQTCKSCGWTKCE